MHFIAWYLLDEQKWVNDKLMPLFSKTPLLPRVLLEEDGVLILINATRDWVPWDYQGYQNAMQKSKAATLNARKWARLWSLGDQAEWLCQPAKLRNVWNRRCQQGPRKMEGPEWTYINIPQCQTQHWLACGHCSSRTGGFDSPAERWFPLWREFGHTRQRHNNARCKKNRSSICLAAQYNSTNISPWHFIPGRPAPATASPSNPF